MKKKIISAVLSALMVVGISMPAFAADPTVIESMTGATDTGASVDIDSDISLPIIKITVPTSTSIIINPFQLEVDKDGDGEGEEVSTDQIVSLVQEISSESNVKLAVNVAELKATPSEGITIATKTAKAATAKSAYLAMEIGADLSNASAAKTTVVATTAGAKKDAAYMLDKGTQQTPAKCQFKIVGDVNANPTKTVSKVVTADPWLDSDEVAIAVKFTFTPQIETTTP